MQTVSLTLDAVFNETIGYNELQFSYYDKLYSLPHLQYIQHTCADTISSLQRKQWFIILVLYSTEWKVFIKYDWTTRWLPGWSVRNNESIYESIKRISSDIHKNIDIRDIQPLVAMDNTFCHKTTAYTMHGIVFAARLFNPEILENTQNGDMYNLNCDFIDGVQKYWNKDILTYFYNNKLSGLIKNSKIDLQDEEIKTNNIMKNRYKIHHNIWKPLLQLFWINKNKNIKNRILDKCEDKNIIIDVSCGDDNLIYDIAKDTNKIVIWNDIYLNRHKPLHKNHNILFTNHNIVDLPFKDKIFDVAICKNTLHHMPHRSHLLASLQTLKRIAKKVIIIEIENPKKTGGIANLLHKYRYCGFLKDVWWAYLENNHFSAIINYIFGKTHNIEEWTFCTKQWKYFWSIINTI